MNKLVEETPIKNPKKKNKTGHGKVFEKEFANSVPQGEIILKRMKDDTMKFKNVQNSFDFFAYKFPQIFFFELKSTKQKSLPFGNIHPYQIDNLYEDSKNPGVVAGIVINFSTTEEYETYFVEAKAIYNFYYKAERKSFSLAWVRENGISLPAKKKRTRYTFDLSGIFEIPLPQ